MLKNRSPQPDDSSALVFTAEACESLDDLLSCLRVALGTQTDLKTLALPPERWERVAGLAAKSGFGPLLFRTLPLTSPVLGIPKSVILRWHCLHLASAFRNNRFYQHLGQILASCNQAGIPVLLLKGVHLMEALYAERAMRVMGDIDILVHRGDLEKAAQIMLDLGYVPDDSVDSQGVPISHPFHRGFIHPTTSVPVEIHFELRNPDDPGQPDLQGFWDRSETMEVAGQAARVLAPEDLLVHLCLHFTGHLLSLFLFVGPSMRGLFDMALLVRRRSAQMNWERLFQTLRQGRCEQEFAISMALVGRLLDAHPPREALARVSAQAAVTPDDLDTLQNQLLVLFGSELVNARLPTTVRFSLQFGPVQWILHLVGTLFPSRSEIADRYGPSCHWYQGFGHYVRNAVRMWHNPWVKWSWRRVVGMCLAPIRGPLPRDTQAVMTHLRRVALLDGRIRGRKK